MIDTMIPHHYQSHVTAQMMMRRRGGLGGGRLTMTVRDCEWCIASAVLTRQWFVWKSVQPHLLPHFLELGELAPAFNRSHRFKTLSVSVFRLTNFLGEKMHSAFVTISLSATDWPTRGEKS